MFLSSPPVSGTVCGNVPSSTTALTPSPTVTTGRRCSKSSPPLRNNKRVAPAKAGAAGRAEPLSNSTHGNNHYLPPFLPPPPIHRDSRRRRSDSDMSNGVHECLSGGVPTTPDTGTRHKGCRRGSTGPGTGCGNLRIVTGTGAEHSLGSSPGNVIGNGFGCCSGNPPTTPSGSCSTPGIRSPPMVCQRRAINKGGVDHGRGWGASGARRSAKNKRLNGVCGYDDDKDRAVESDGDGGGRASGLGSFDGNTSSGGGIPGGASRRSGYTRSRLGRVNDRGRNRGGCDGGCEKDEGSSLKGEGREEKDEGTDAEARGAKHSERREESPDPTSSVERFSGDSDGADASERGSGGDAASDAEAQGSGCSRRKRRVRRGRRWEREPSADGREEVRRL